MRSLAIIFVVVRHGSLLEQANTGFPWIKLIDGVEMFFVLSGFLIGGILLKILNSSNKLNLKSVYRFWVRRWFRTLPNYYLVLILNILFVYFGFIQGDLSQFNWKFFFFLQNFSHGFHGFFWESWSLSIEEWFYLLFPLVLGLFYSLFRLGFLSKKNVFLSSVVVFLLTPFLLRYVVASTFDVDRFWLVTRIFKVVIYRLDGIAFGLLAAFVKYYYSSLWLRCKNSSFVLGLAISYFTLYFPWIPNAFSTKVYMVSLVSFGCFLLLPKFDSMKSAPSKITKIFTHVSLISYSMYLINLALVADVIRNNFPPIDALSAWLTYVIYWLIVLLASTLLYKFYEKPLTDLRDRWKT